MKRFTNLKSKIMIAALIPVIISFAFICGVIFLLLFNSLHQTAKAEFLQIGHKYAYSFESKIDNAMNYLSIITSELETLIEIGDTDRETLQEMILRTFDEYKLLDGSSVYFEHNMYDGRDDDYIGTEYGTAKSGRICWYFYMDEGKTAYLPEGLENDIEFELPHYTKAKEANKPIFTDPVAHEVDGKNIFMFTLTYPVHDNSGNFIGAVTVDLFLDDIYAQLQSEKIYETGYIIICNENERVIYSPNYEDIGGTREEAGLYYQLTPTENATYFNAKSILNSKETLITVESIYIPQLDSNFYISVAAPIEEINAYGTRVTVYLIIFSLLVVLAIAFLLNYFIGKLSAPLNEITESVDKIAGGEYSARIKGAYKGEFAVVKNSVNKMADSIEEYITDLKDTQSALDERLRQQSLMAAISRSFLSNADMETLITNALRMTGEFIGIAQILYYKLEDDGATFTCQCEWINSKMGKQTSIGNKQVVPDSLLSYIKTLPERQQFCLNSNDPALREVMEPYQVNYENYISVPIFLKGDLFGALDLFRDDGKEWSDSSISLAALVASLLSGGIEKHSIETELIAAKDLAEQGSRAKSQFLSRMSHEMRTPMNAIIGMTSIATSSDDFAKKEYCLERIDNASRHLLGVINDILDMSKIEANKFNLSYSEFNFGRMLQRVVDVVNYNIEEKHLRFSFFTDPALSQFLIGDEQHLAQVITNLLTNAAKFTPEEGSIQLNVFVLNEDNGLFTLQIEVIDSGIGIDEEQQAKLFHSFEQADGSIARKFGGTGLGLAISKHIVELMGGMIWIESELGKGSKFAFTAKLEKAQDPVEPGQSADEGQDTALPNSFVGKTALLAEDVDINREIMLAVLEDTDLKIDCAENGRQAVEMFAADPQKYDIILMDVHMPEIDGLEATRMIRMLDVPTGGTVPIVAMTADVFNEDIIKCLESGMNDHIGKPVDFGELFRKLRKYLN